MADRSVAQWAEGWRAGMEQAARIVRAEGAGTRSEREETVRRILSASSQEGSGDAEARLRAFAKRYGAEDVIVGFDPLARKSDGPWRIEWRRRYPDGVLSDPRCAEASDFAALVIGAEEWEAENDRREPQHARAVPGSGTGEGGR